MKKQRFTSKKIPKECEDVPNSKPSSINTRAKRSQSVVTKPIHQTQICPVCLNEIPSEYVKLNCQHRLCSTECACELWKFSEQCPLCRSEIIYIEQQNGQKITKEEISEESSQSDGSFVPRCEQCWADIDQGQQRRICSCCSSRFIHKRCEIVRSKFWTCNRCFQMTDSEGNQVYPMIPYNPILHYLMLNALNQKTN